MCTYAISAAVARYFAQQRRCVNESRVGPARPDGRIRYSSASLAASGSVLGSKVDSERDESVAQGDATLKGAEITLTNRSAAAVVVGGETVEPGADYSRPAVTDAEGNWSFEGLPYGTYEVRETKPSAGYRINTSWRAGFPPFFTSRSLFRYPPLFPGGVPCWTLA